MRMRDWLGISKRNQKRLIRIMQALLLGIALYGVSQSRTTVAVNAGACLLVTFLPALLERDHNIVMHTGLVLWITAAVFLHAAGTLGPYTAVWWWDHLTHTLSAGVVAAAGYAGFRAVEAHSPDLHFPEKLFSVFILIFVMAFGVLWELLEYGIALASHVLPMASVLTQYGINDTMMDLMFNLLGGGVTAIFGEAYLHGISGELFPSLAVRQER